VDVDEITLGFNNVVGILTNAAGIRGAAIKTTIEAATHVAVIKVTTVVAIKGATIIINLDTNAALPISPTDNPLPGVTVTLTLMISQSTMRPFMIST